jgi:hypothetical protein
MLLLSFRWLDGEAGAARAAGLGRCLVELGRIDRYAVGWSWSVVPVSVRRPARRAAPRLQSVDEDVEAGGEPLVAVVEPVGPWCSR